MLIRLMTRISYIVNTVIGNFLHHLLGEHPVFGVGLPLQEVPNVRSDGLTLGNSIHFGIGFDDASSLTTIPVERLNPFGTFDALKGHLVGHLPNRCGEAIGCHCFAPDFPERIAAAMSDAASSLPNSNLSLMARCL